MRLSLIKQIFFSNFFRMFFSPILMKNKSQKDKSKYCLCAITIPIKEYLTKSYKSLAKLSLCFSLSFIDNIIYKGKIFVKFSGIVGIFFLCMLCLASCSTKSLIEKKEIVFAVGGGVTEQKIWQNIVDKFNNSQKDIKVKLEMVQSNSGEDYQSKILTKIAGNVAPDVFHLDTIYLPYFVKKDVLLDLSQFLSQDKKLKQDFFSKALDLLIYGNKIYGLPMSVQPVVIYYNKTLFDKNKIPYPTNDWTWDDFLSIAKKLTKYSPDGAIKEIGFDPIIGYEPWMFQNNGNILNAGMTECTIDSAETVEAIQFFTDLVNKYKVSLSPIQRTGLDMSSEQMFMTGRVGMVMCGRWITAQLWKKKDLKWDVVLPPKKKISVTALLEAANVISKNTRYPKEAYEFVKFTCGPEGQTMYADLGISVPSCRSVAENKSILNPNGLPPEHSDVFIKAIENSRTIPKYFNLSRINYIIAQEFDMVYEGRISVKEACKKIKVKVDKILKSKE